MRLHRASALPCFPHHPLCYQPADFCDRSKNYLNTILKFLPLPQHPKKMCSGRYRLVLKQKLRELKMVRILGKPSVVFYRLQVASTHPELKDQAF